MSIEARPIQITEADQVKPALAKALADGRPWFVDIVTESQITETPPVAGWVSAEAERKQGSLVR